MRIVYVTSTGFLDGDLPLIHHLQHQGVEVHLFLTIADYSKRGSLIDIKDVLPVNKIIKATAYKEFELFNNTLLN